MIQSRGQARGGVRRPGGIGARAQIARAHAHICAQDMDASSANCDTYHSTYQPAPRNGYKERAARSTNATSATATPTRRLEQDLEPRAVDVSAVPTHPGGIDPAQPRDGDHDRTSEVQPTIGRALPSKVIGSCCFELRLEHPSQIIQDRNPSSRNSRAAGSRDDVADPLELPSARMMKTYQMFADPAGEGENFWPSRHDHPATPISG